MSLLLEELLKMKFNILDKLSFSISGLSGSLSAFLEEEYKFCIQDGHNANTLKELFHVKIVEDKISHNAYKVRNPIVVDNKGVAISDYSGNLARIDFDKLGYSTCNVTCDKDFNHFFFANLLEYLICLGFINLGYTFCHASAFMKEGKTILCPGWRNVGKTNLLLSFLNDGAEFLSDDWVLIDSNGSLFSLPKRINLLHYNYRQNMGAVKNFDPVLGTFSDTVLQIIEGSKYKYTNLSDAQLKSSLKRRVHFEEFFKRDRLKKSENIDFIFFLNHNNARNEVSVMKYDIKKIQNRMIRVLDYEQKPFKSAYDFYKFYTGKGNKLIDSARKINGNILSAAFHNASNTFRVDTSDQNQSEFIKQHIIRIVG